MAVESRECCLSRAMGSSCGAEGRCWGTSEAASPDQGSWTGGRQWPQICWDSVWGPAELCLSPWLPCPGPPPDSHLSSVFQADLICSCLAEDPLGARDEVQRPF